MTSATELICCADVGDWINVSTDDELVYVDGPLEGFGTTRSGDRYAFRVLEILAGRVWHWALVPASLDCSVEEAFDVADSGDGWVSILEDGRTLEENRVRVVAMSGQVPNSYRGWAG